MSYLCSSKHFTWLSVGACPVFLAVTECKIRVHTRRRTVLINANFWVRVQHPHLYAAFSVCVFTHKLLICMLWNLFNSSLKLTPRLCSIFLVPNFAPINLKSTKQQAVLMLPFESASLHSLARKVITTLHLALSHVFIHHYVASLCM